MRSSPTDLTPSAFSADSAAQCDVARLPSSSPAAASMIEPEQTETVHVAVSCALRSQARTFSSRACSIVEKPPGTKMTSGVSVSSKECVAPTTSTPLSAAIGPGACQTKRTSAPGRKRRHS